MGAREPKPRICSPAQHIYTCLSSAECEPLLNANGFGYLFLVNNSINLPGGSYACRSLVPISFVNGHLLQNQKTEKSGWAERSRWSRVSALSTGLHTAPCGGLHIAFPGSVIPGNLLASVCLCFLTCEMHGVVWMKWLSAKQQHSVPARSPCACAVCTCMCVWAVVSEFEQCTALSSSDLF